MILFLPSTLHPNTATEAIADTGCTGHYFSITAPAQNIQPDDHDISVALPDGNQIKSKHKCDLPWEQLLPEVRGVYMFPQLKSSNLISIGNFCDNGYKVVFLKDTVEIINLAMNDVVLTGHRKVVHGNMWMIPLQQQYKNISHKHSKTQEHSNNVYELKIKRRLYSIFMGCALAQQSWHGSRQSNKVILQHGQASQPKW
eukprot:7614790-Ditylum_brightwellii.AAC.1